jgi:hypothetical protein
VDKSEALAKIYEHLELLVDYEILSPSTAETLATNIKYVIMDIDSLEEETPRWANHPSAQKNKKLTAEEVVQLWERAKSREHGDTE